MKLKDLNGVYQKYQSISVTMFYEGGYKELYFGYLADFVTTKEYKEYKNYDVFDLCIDEVYGKEEERWFNYLSVSIREGVKK